MCFKDKVQNGNPKISHIVLTGERIGAYACISGQLALTARVRACVRACVFEWRTNRKRAYMVTCITHQGSAFSLPANKQIPSKCPTPVLLRRFHWCTCNLCICSVGS